MQKRCFSPRMKSLPSEIAGELSAAEARLSALSARARTIVDSAAATCLRLNLYANLNRSASGVEVGLDYLRRVDDQWPPRATAAPTLRPGLRSVPSSRR